MHTPKVYIVILNYKTWADTIECVESLLQLDYTNFNIVIVDNNSPNDSVTQIESWLMEEFAKSSRYPLPFFSYAIIEDSRVDELVNNTPFITLIKSSSNRGYAAGNNIGIKYVINRGDYDYLWIINNDIVVFNNTLDKVIDYFSTLDSSVGMVGTTVKFYYRPQVIQNIGCSFNPILGFPSQIGLNRFDSEVDFLKNKKKIKYISGCSVVVSKCFINSVGLMSECYFLYFEEIDWAIQGKKKGFSIDFCYESTILHKDGASTKEDTQSLLSSPFSDYHFTRSKMHFTRKYYRGYLLTVYLSFFLVILNRIKRGQYKSVRSIIQALLGNPFHL